MTSFTPYIRKVEFRDIDGLGHVNNAVYLSYIENARLQFWQELNDDRNAYQQDPFVLGEAKLRFIAPIFLGDEVRIRTRVTHVGTRSFTLQYLIERVSDGARVATSESTLVMYEESRGGTYPIPEGVKLRLQNALTA